MSDFRSAAEQELNRLEKQLEAEQAASPTYQRIKKIRALLADYPVQAQASISATAVTMATAAEPPSLTFTPPEPPRANGLHRPMLGQPSRKARLIELVGTLIDAGQGTTTRQTIISNAIVHGLVPTDTKKAVKIIAPILSEARNKYQSDGKGNWTRRHESQAQH